MAKHSDGADASRRTGVIFVGFILALVLLAVLLVATLGEPSEAKDFRECFQRLPVVGICAGKAGFEMGNG